MDMDLDGISSVSSLQSLAKLLSDPQEDDDDDDDCGPHSSVSAMGPGNIGPVKKETTVTGTAQVKNENTKAIWNTEEVPEGSEFDDTWDPREEPEYEILFKQRVGTEEMFLGMSRKDASTACCEDMVTPYRVTNSVKSQIKIKLPETKFSDITLDLQDKVLDLRTPQKKLLLHLPHPVDSKNGKALFLSEEEILEVTLRMTREFDYINFA